jgi:mannose-1-phosphate guanylyltransferase
MNKNHFAVIMAGGIGSRFWPVSTTQFPKQFHDMLGTGKSLLQTTFSRLSKFIPSENILILTNACYQDLVIKQLPGIQPHQLVLEPVMRNTAPCILLAALKINKINPSAQMLVAPSDHWIEDEQAFKKDVQNCFSYCETHNALLTLGIPPTFPNTGYGYIAYDKADTLPIKKVKQFKEKPDYKTAKQFLEAGNFLWNAGIFIWNTNHIIEAFKHQLPNMYELFNSGYNVLNTNQERAFIEQEYDKAQNISIDYGILEKNQNVYVKIANFDWNDLGTWGALYDKLDKDQNKNAVVRAQTLLNDTAGSIVYTASEKLVVIEGLKDYIVVDKEKVLLIFPKAKEQDIKQLLAQVKEKFGDKYI